MKPGINHCRCARVDTYCIRVSLQPRNRHAPAHRLAQSTGVWLSCGPGASPDRACISYGESWYDDRSPAYRTSAYLDRPFVPGDCGAPELVPSYGSRSLCGRGYHALQLSSHPSTSDRFTHEVDFELRDDSSCLGVSTGTAVRGHRLTAYYEDIGGRTPRLVAA